MLRPGIGLVGDNYLARGSSKPEGGPADPLADRYGIEAARWVNSRRDLRLRGICAVVVKPGLVVPGDKICKR